MNGKYNLIPIRDADKYLIMEWRNEQIDILRQKEPLTVEMQEAYFRLVVEREFELEKPSQLLFSFLENDILVGYGGLVHIDWDSRNAEISFITKTNRNVNPNRFKEDWKQYLKILKELVESQLGFIKIYTYAYDIRPRLFEVLLESEFYEEARLKNHVQINDKMQDVLIHSFFCDVLEFRIAVEDDLRKYYEWANERVVRENSFNTEPIMMDDHWKWFLNKVKDPKSLLLLAVSFGEDVGQIRFDQVAPIEYEIDFSISPIHRGRGLGAKMIRFGVNELKQYDANVKRVTGKVKEGNISSIKSFVNAGFTIAKNGNNGFYTYCLDL